MKGSIRANGPEARFEEMAKAYDWTVTKRGWPDFVCFNHIGELIAVEVKPRDAKGNIQPLKLSQLRVMVSLTQAGIRCYVSDGEVMEPFCPIKHRSHGRPSKSLDTRPNRGKRPPLKKVG